MHQLSSSTLNLYALYPVLMICKTTVIELRGKVSDSKLQDYKNNIYFKIFSTVRWIKHDCMNMNVAFCFLTPARTQKGTPKNSVILAPYSSHTEGLVLEMKVPRRSGKQLNVQRSENECWLEAALIVAYNDSATHLNANRIWTAYKICYERLLLPPQVDDRNENNTGQKIFIFSKHNSKYFSSIFVKIIYRCWSEIIHSEH